MIAIEIQTLPRLPVRYRHSGAATGAGGRARGTRQPFSVGVKSANGAHPID